MKYYTKKKKSIYVLFVVALCSLSLMGQAKQDVKTITGQITYLDAPLPEVNIVLKGTHKGVRTDASGFFSIDAKVGDELLFSHVGFTTVSIIIEDVTQVLNLKMTPKTNELETAVVKARSKVGTVLAFSEKSNEEFETSRGTVNAKASGYAIPLVEGKELSLGAPSLADALNGKRAGVIGANGKVWLAGKKGNAVWDIDGSIYETEPSIDISSIVEVRILKSVGSIVKYGPVGRNGVIVVRTSAGSSGTYEAEKKKVTEQYTNQNYYQNDAIVLNTETSLSESPLKSDPALADTNGPLQKITGVVSYLENPLADVHITISGSKERVAKTNAKGKYKIRARIGEKIAFSHVGLQTVYVIVEDVTSKLNIEMVGAVNELDEVVVVRNTVTGKVMEQVQKKEKEFETSRGKFNPKKLGYDIGFVDGDEVSNVYLNIMEALEGKITSYFYDKGQNKAYLRGGDMTINNDYPVAWEVDGVFTTNAPSLDLSQIESIHALKSVAATNKYGTLGAGGVIVINTKFGLYNVAEEERKKVTEQHTNKNFYADDAAQWDAMDASSNPYIRAIEKFSNKREAFTYYQDVLKHEIEAYDVHIAIAKKFRTHYGDLELAGSILSALAATHEDNSEILKSIAYQCQEMKLKKESIAIYEQVMRLRPDYAQSYRDLANAYHESEQFKKAWRIYMSYLMKGHDVSGEGIGQLLYNEMEYLYFNRKNQTTIRERFVPRNEDINEFRNDVRIVIEWNASEAEFDLEFVSPDRRAYVFEHSLAANQTLITDEKIKGYSSKEFMIDDIGDGEWLVNFKYHGNKKPEPTFFIVSIYYHWGKATQRKETAVYKFQDERRKVQLYRLNKQLLVATN